MFIGTVPFDLELGIFCQHAVCKEMSGKGSHNESFLAVKACNVHSSLYIFFGLLFTGYDSGRV